MLLISLAIIYTVHASSKDPHDTSNPNIYYNSDTNTSTNNHEYFTSHTQSCYYHGNLLNTNEIPMLYASLLCPNGGIQATAEAFNPSAYYLDLEKDKYDFNYDVIDTNKHKKCRLAYSFIISNPAKVDEMIGDYSSLKPRKLYTNCQLGDNDFDGNAWLATITSWISNYLDNVQFVSDMKFKWSPSRGGTTHGLASSITNMRGEDAAVTNKDVSNKFITIFAIGIFLVFIASTSFLKQYMQSTNSASILIMSIYMIISIHSTTSDMILFDSTGDSNPTHSRWSSQITNSSSLTNFYTQIAADFVVDDCIWNISSVTMVGVYTMNTSKVGRDDASWNVNVYVDQAGLPGVLYESHLGITQFIDTYIGSISATRFYWDVMITFTTPIQILQPGTYWISIQAVWPYYDIIADAQDQWLWSQTTVTRGYQSTYIERDWGIGSFCDASWFNWQLLTDCSTGCSDCNDSMFMLVGTRETCDPTFDPTIDPTSHPTLSPTDHTRTPTIYPTMYPTTPTIYATINPTSSSDSINDVSDSKESSELESVLVSGYKYDGFNDENKVDMENDIETNKFYPIGNIEIQFGESVYLNVVMICGLCLVVNAVIYCVYKYYGTVSSNN